VSAAATAAAERMARLEAKLASLPAAPGCYLFIGEKGEALYVGKAKSLRSRVRSYFQESTGDSRYFIPLLRRWCFDLETVVTATEKEAAVLENQLIKQHKPRFNVKLRDDKEFLCLRLDDKRAWPRLETVRRPQPDKAKYFGPYHSASSARRTLHLVNKHFQLRTCSDADFASRKRPCLQHQIKRCLAPCVLDVDHEAYAAQVRAVGLFLEGRHDELTRELEDLMRDAARAMEFERAAIYRDQLRAVTAIHEAQRVAAVSDVDQDVVGVYREGSNVEIEVIFVRAGRVADTVSFSLRKVELPDEEVLAGFLSEYYAGDEGGALIPAEVLVPVLPEGAEGVADWLSERRGRKVQLLVPQRGGRRRLLDMAAENARHAYREKQRATEDVEARLEELRERLRLPTLPRRIECCDISHLGGNDTVGAIVALHDGALDKKRYRSFHVRGVSGGDDYGAMAEVLSRRFRRGKAARERGEAAAESNDASTTPAAIGTDGVLVAAEPTPSQRSPRDADWDLPDLFVVDGGRGQLAVALAAARDLGLHDLAIVGLAKERETATGDKVVDRVYLPGQKNGIPLRATSSALFFLARARDEAHRFANVARKKLGGARRMQSELDALPGIGDKTKKALLRHLGSVRAVREASDEALLAVPGVSRRHLAALRAVLSAPAAEVATAAASSESVASDREPEPQRLAGRGAVSS
jgi:excinuclease ABC subunit C